MDITNRLSAILKKIEDTINNQCNKLQVCAQPRVSNLASGNLVQSRPNQPTSSESCACDSNVMSKAQTAREQG